MADNVTANPGSGGATFATDEIGGIHYPISKIVFGALGSATLVSAADPLPVVAMGTVSCLQSGTWDVGTLGTITSVVHVDDNSGSLTVDAPVGTPVFVRLSDGSAPITTLPVSLASVPSHAVTNAGTFAVQATQSGTWTVQPGNTANTTAWLVTGTGGTFPTTQSGTWNIGTVTTVSAVTTITNVVHVDDNAGSLTVDAPVGTPAFVRLSDGSSAISTLPVSLASVPSHAVTNAGTFAVQAAQSGTWTTTVTQATGTNLHAVVDSITLPVTTNAGATAKTSDFDTGAGTDTVTLFGIALPASGGAVAGGTATNPVRVDPTGATAQPVTNTGTFAVQAAQSGTWNVGTVTTITNVVHVDDNSASLTVDAPVATPVFVRLSDGSAAITTLPVSLASVPSHAVTNAGTFAVQADTELPAAVALSDALSNPTSPLVGSCGLLWNPASTQWERQSGVFEGTLLALAARTAHTLSAGQVNRGGRGLVLWLYVSVASGTGGLQLGLLGTDPASGFSLFLHNAPTAITATGFYGYIFGPLPDAGAVTGWPGGTAIIQARWSGFLPRTWVAQVVHGDASSYTYSLGFAEIP